MIIAMMIITPNALHLTRFIQPYIVIPITPIFFTIIVTKKAEAIDDKTITQTYPLSILTAVNTIP